MAVIALLVAVMVVLMVVMDVLMAVMDVLMTVMDALTTVTGVLMTVTGVLMTVTGVLMAVIRCHHGNTRNIPAYFLYKWFSGFTLFNQECAIPAIFVFLTRLKWSTGPNRAHCFYTF